MSPSPLFVVSPHLDDAVFSCGMLLAMHPGSIVCTVFAGAPRPALSTPWDQASGFADSDAASEARRREDDRALALLDARPIRLAFTDSQYRQSPAIETVSAALDEAWQRSGHLAFVAPIGLYHSDHILVADACCALLDSAKVAPLIAYEEAIYRHIGRIALERRGSLASRGILTTPDTDQILMPVRSARAAAQKWRSVRAYRSQLRALGDAHPNDLVEPERYWRLSLARSVYRRADHSR
jgi:LmbE family N-acetylglucosaminyl deacetylase